MSKNILKRVLVTFALLLTTLTAQDKVDAIEAARQAKAAAEKATAAAEAATDAAINQAASQAADNARARMKQGKLDKEARIAAEIAAAEEAELDAAASAAAEDAKRKMALELGLEYESPVSEEDSVDVIQDTLVTEESEVVVAKEKLGWSVGAAASVGLVKGATFSKVPTGGTIIVTTPLSFEVGPLNYTVSLGVGGYTGENNLVSFNPTFAGIGGNLTLVELVFAEGHVGLIGEGPGFRGFAGITLEKLMSKGLDLPVNVLVGSEIFFSSDMAGAGNSSYWASLGLRLDYEF